MDNLGKWKNFLDKIFSNAGAKFKKIIRVLFTLEIIAAVVVGIWFLFAGFTGVYYNGRYDDDYVFLGVVTLLCAPITAYILSFLTYCSAELFDNIAIIKNNTAIQEQPTQTEQKEKD